MAKDSNGYGLEANKIQVSVNDKGCWVVTSHKPNPDGYIRLWRNKKTIKLHRQVYEENNGPIPNGMVVMHTCDNPPCINPEHLVLGTQRKNMEDAINKGRLVLGVGYSIGGKRARRRNGSK